MQALPSKPWVKPDDFSAHHLIASTGDNQVTLKIDSSGRLEFFVYENNRDNIIPLIWTECLLPVLQKTGSFWKKQGRGVFSKGFLYKKTTELQIRIDKLAKI